MPGSGENAYSAVGAAKDEEDPALDDSEDMLEIRLLEAKSGKAKTVRLPARGTVAQLQALVESEFELPPPRQRLIAGGRQLEAADLLSAHKLGGQTVHVATRRETPVAPEPVATRNPLLLSALGASAWAEPTQESYVGGSLEPRFHAAARVRMLSSLLALYSTLQCLNAVLDLTAPTDDGTENVPPAQALLGLVVSAAGVWVGLAGLKASRTLDAEAADRYDRCLRLYAVVALGFGAYTALTFAKPEDRHGHDDWYVNGTQVKIGTEDDDQGVLPQDSRSTLLLSALVTLVIWSAIWFACIHNSSQLRTILRAHATPPAPPMAAPPTAAFTPHEV
ncbi:hypothetical protein M885DRAFT_515287 [Pelagophyceae sp. CCMP2097]|nr:hypothetical protein M885DRAFT_515287 [Pelagophyceae sp. CCMP2097]|mmetsp:Transcript_4289/g.13447  ORF Transcript_4289/g.13447 Transcript_4289/m.13447 type:complete len:335 (+) Transcript_4289:84-1088(+)